MPPKKKPMTAAQLDKWNKTLIGAVGDLEDRVKAENGRVEQATSLFTAAAEDIGRVIETHKKRGIKATKLNDVSGLSEVKKILTSTNKLETGLNKIDKATDTILVDAGYVADDFEKVVDACDKALAANPSDSDKRTIAAVKTSAEAWIDRTVTRVEAAVNFCLTGKNGVIKKFETQADAEVAKSGTAKAARDKRETDAYMADARHLAKRKGKFNKAADSVDGDCALVGLANLAKFSSGSKEEKDAGKTLAAAEASLAEMKTLYGELHTSWTGAADADRDFVRDHGAGKKVDAFLASAATQITKSEKLVANAKKGFVAACAAAKKKAIADKKKAKAEKKTQKRKSF